MGQGRPIQPCPDRMSGQGGPAGAGQTRVCPQGRPRGGALSLVAFFGQAKKATRPLARAFVRRNKLQSGRKTTSTVVQGRYERGLWLDFARLKLGAPHHPGCMRATPFLCSCKERGGKKHAPAAAPLRGSRAETGSGRPVRRPILVLGRRTSNGHPWPFGLPPLGLVTARLRGIFPSPPIKGEGESFAQRIPHHAGGLSNPRLALLIVRIAVRSVSALGRFFHDHHHCK
jgi:hypothetical protein